MSDQATFTPSTDQNVVRLDGKPVTPEEHKRRVAILQATAYDGLMLPAIAPRASVATDAMAPAVRLCLRAVAAVTTGVSAAFMKSDGTAFVLRGPTWTEEMSALAPQLAVEMQEQLAPDGSPLIEGFFFEGEGEPGPGWVRAYP